MSLNPDLMPDDHILDGRPPDRWGMSQLQCTKPTHRPCSPRCKATFCPKQGKSPDVPTCRGAAVVFPSWAMVCMTLVTALQAVHRLSRSMLQSKICMRGADFLPHGQRQHRDAMPTYSFYALMGFHNFQINQDIQTIAHGTNFKELQQHCILLSQMHCQQSNAVLRASSMATS